MVFNTQHVTDSKIYRGLNIKIIIRVVRVLRVDLYFGLCPPLQIRQDNGRPLLSFIIRDG